MKLSKYTDVVTLVANVGVLISVIFLIVQIQQANQIATRDSRDEIGNSFIENNGYILENPELATLLSKLRNPSPELTDLEKVQAYFIAENQFFVWAKINLGAETDLLPEVQQQSYIDLARRFMKTYSGLLPYIEDALLSINSSKAKAEANGGGIYIAMWDEIDASKR